jgi:hypothetical protein
MCYIMYYHHILTSAILILGYLFDTGDLSFGFLLAEISNIPLYFTAFVIHEPSWKLLLKWFVLMEFIMFLLFRCIGMIGILNASSVCIVNVLVWIIYIASVFWTVQLLQQLNKLFFIKKLN